jgi:hypothetical protein
MFSNRHKFLFIFNSKTFFVTIRKFAPPKKRKIKRKKKKTAVKFNRRTWRAWDVGFALGSSIADRSYRRSSSLQRGFLFSRSDGLSSWQERGRGRQAATFTAQQQQLREPQELEALKSLLHLVVLHVFAANFLSLLELQGPVR